MKERFQDNGWKRPEIIHQVPTKWGWVVWHPEKLVLGEKCDIGFGTYINAFAGVRIGARAELGSHCSVNSISTVDHKQGKITIGDGAKIGSHCVIMPGVRIGIGATVGACSFVNKDIPPHSLAYGVPAHIVK